MSFDKSIVILGADNWALLMYSGLLELSVILTIIYAGSEWSTANVRSGYSLFYGCLNIMGCMGTTYNSSNIGIDYAHIDGGPDNPG